MSRGWATTGKLFLLLFIVVILLIAFELTTIMHSGLSARNPPTAAEVMLATTVRRFATPPAARNMRNPIPHTAEVLKEGREHFADHCAQCHANDGSGKTEIGQNLYPKTPDMRSARTQNLTDGEIFSIIKNGVRLTGMPAWGDEDDETDNWKLVHFIRHLPKITAAEIEEMKTMNPVSEHERREKKEEHEFLEGAHQHEGH